MAADIELPSTARELTPPGLIAVAWCGFGVAALLVALRCYARISELRTLHIDDYWMLAALVFLLANAILQTLQTPSTYFLAWLEAGRESPAEQILEVGNVYVRYEFVIIALFWSVTWSVKASFLAMYKRLFSRLPEYLRLWWAVSIFTALAYVGCWMASIWTCHPPSLYFQFGTSHSWICTKPIDVRGSVISISYSTAVDVLSDLMIMALPVRILPTLRMSGAQKQGLALIFCIGFLIIATALVRLSQIVTTQRSDPVGLAVWGLVESSVAVIVGTLPALKGFISRKVQNTLISSTFGGSRSRRQYGGVSDEERHELSKNRATVGVIPLRDRSTSESAQRVPDGQIAIERQYIGQ